MKLTLEPRTAAAVTEVVVRPERLAARVLCRAVSATVPAPEAVAPVSSAAVAVRVVPAATVIVALLTVDPDSVRVYAPLIATVADPKFPVKVRLAVRVESTLHVVEIELMSAPNVDSRALTLVVPLPLIDFPVRRTAVPANVVPDETEKVAVPIVLPDTVNV